jgi:biotin carboxyl carrier protein
MQNYKVTVNGKVYEVTVEETSQSAAATSSISSPAEKPITSKPGTAEAGGIMSIKVKPGDEVKYGQVLLTLEALKMENEIVAPEAGVVKEIFTQTGAMVNVGDLLVSLRSL